MAFPKIDIRRFHFRLKRKPPYRDAEFPRSTDIPSICGETGERIVIAIRILPLAATVSGIGT
jgi:hypothetical protein